MLLFPSKIHMYRLHTAWCSW